MIVCSKRENWRLVSSGFYGNRLRSWNTLEELKVSGWTGLVSVRTMLGGGGPCVYDVPAERVSEVVVSLGVPEVMCCFNEGAVDSTVAIQGEYLNDIVRLDDYAFDGAFFFSRAKEKMRKALRTESQTRYGLMARELLRVFMTPSSWEDFEVLLEEYPGHVLEVSVYEGNVGDLPGRNTIVWEVRRY